MVKWGGLTLFQTNRIMHSIKKLIPSLLFCKCFSNEFRLKFVMYGLKGRARLFHFNDGLACIGVGVSR